jgi:predicted ATPase/class 3 adenylate cyclase
MTREEHWGASGSGFDAKRNGAPAIRMPGKLYGREEETAELKRFVRRAQHGRPALMLVTGAPGVGKTTFLDQLKDIVRRENGRFFSSKFDQFKSNVPYAALAQAFQELVHQILAEPEAELAAWGRRLLAASAGNGRAILDIIPDLELITGLQPPVAVLSPVEARRRFDRVFTDVVRTLASGMMPLCLFMDDLQWADAGSMELLTRAVSRAETGPLMFVAACREGEVALGTPLAAALDALETAGTRCERIVLRPLGPSHVREFLADTLHAAPQEVAALSELLHSRTQGNPLFLTQLLYFLHDAVLVSFDYSTNRWRWNLDRIRTEAVSEDVLNLMRTRMGQLPAGTRAILSVAACLGSSFSPDMIALAAARSDVASALAEGVLFDLIVPIPVLGDVSSAGPRYRFVHDRIQQAALELIPPEATPAFRLEIGRQLLSGLQPVQTSAAMTDVLNNFNVGCELITDPAEAVMLATLNLVAGRKARESLAHRDALDYLSIAIKMLGPDAWRIRPELAFEIYENAFECEYLTGSFVRAEELFQLLLKHAATRLERGRIYLTKILLDTSEERYDSAITLGAKALRMFGVRYSRSPRIWHLIWELLMVQLRLRGRRPGELLRQAKLQDPEKIAALKILVGLFPPAYFLSPDLLMVSGLKAVNYSLRHGISDLSASGFVLYGLCLGSAFGNLRAGYGFGRLAVDLAETASDPAVLCKVLVIFALFIKYWRDPIADSLPMIERAQRLALRAEDHQYANYAIIGRLSLDFSRGIPLPELDAYCAKYERYVCQSNDAFPIEAFIMWQSSVLALTGRTPSAYSLSQPLYDEQAAEQRYRRTRNLTLLAYQYTLRAQLAYLFGRHADALALSDLADAVIASAPGQITVADHYLYRGLAAATGLTSRTGRTRKLRAVVRKCLRRLRHYAANSPKNFLPYARLLEAQCERANGRPHSALRLFNQAADLAEAQQLRHIVGVANEQAALCLLEDGQQRTATSHLSWAVSAYADWGASAKVSCLEEQFAELLARAPRPASAPDAAHRPVTSDATAAPDLVSATAALRAMASERRHDHVMVNLMEIIRAQTSAERVCFVTRPGDGYRLEASVRGPDKTSLVAPDWDATGEGFSPAVLNYVVHTGNDLEIDNPHLDVRFARCAYLAHRQPHSVMCTAIVKQSELVGLVYLERYKSGAFETGHLQWVRILGSELGLTMWTDRLRRYREYLHRFAPAAAAQQIDAEPNHPDLAAREKDVSVMFADLAGYTLMHESMDARQTNALVNRAFSDFIEEIHRFHGALLDVRGDELLVLFEDDGPEVHARNAAAAALAIQRAAAQLNESRADDRTLITVNIGINSGPTSVGLQPIEFAGGARWRYDVTGTTVNVAARIRTLARGGEILLSAATCARLGTGFQCEDTGEHYLKNVSAPVRVLRLAPFERRPDEAANG